MGPCEPTLDPHFSLRATIFFTGISGFFSKISNSVYLIFLIIHHTKEATEKFIFSYAKAFLKTFFLYPKQTYEVPFKQFNYCIANGDISHDYVYAI